ncbi:MAG: hypothetical protein COX46_05820, partial [bacterium (Candidatus Ratteibacteria) CG23_combo_of_CG06-09_8_20_14_all_48_7]
MELLPRRKEIRLKNYNYASNGYYFVTICTNKNRPCIKKYRREMEEILLNLPKKFPGVIIDYYNLMPTHIHIILFFENVHTPLSQVIRSFKALVTKVTGEKFF